LEGITPVREEWLFRTTGNRKFHPAAKQYEEASIFIPVWAIPDCE